MRVHEGETDRVEKMRSFGNGMSIYREVFAGNPTVIGFMNLYKYHQILHDGTKHMKFKIYKNLLEKGAVLDSLKDSLMTCWT